MKSRTFNYVSEECMCPKLATRADTNIIMDIKTAHAVENYMTSEPAISPNSKWKETMPKCVLIEFCIITNYKFGSKYFAISSYVTKVT